MIADKNPPGKVQGEEIGIESGRRPNILVLILDTLRARNVSCYGYSVRTTPHLDAFAQDAVLFKRAYTTTTWTVPSHASMLSGLYLSQHRVENIQRDRRFHQAIVPLPSALREVGYKSAGFSQNGRMLDVLGLERQLF